MDPNKRLEQRFSDAMDRAAEEELPSEVTAKLLEILDLIRDHPGQSGPRIMAWPALDEVAALAPSLKQHIKAIQRVLGERRPQ
jgi:hypothetical protein